MRQLWQRQWRVQQPTYPTLSLPPFLLVDTVCRFLVSCAPQARHLAVFFLLPHALQSQSLLPCRNRIDLVVTRACKVETTSSPILEEFHRILIHPAHSSQFCPTLTMRLLYPP